MYKDISIKFGRTIKFFSIHLTNFHDALSVVEAYATNTINLNVYEFESEKFFNLVDIYLSNFSTPQPRCEIA